MIMSKIRWESRQLFARRGTRNATATFGMYLTHREADYSLQWHVCLIDEYYEYHPRYYPNITALKAAVTPWLLGGELPT